MSFLDLFKKSGTRIMSKAAALDEEGYLLDEDSPFAMQEAYKALRTNLIFSVPDEGCKVILITSSVQGEAKTTTAINLAIAFAENGSRTVLIDADLRLPTGATRLKVEQRPGLSNLLVGMSSFGESIRKLPCGLDFIPAGDIPPNPTELLGSDVMGRFIDALKQRYDYVIIDTPPVCTVADAAILAGRANGVALTVRQNVASRESVADAIRRLEFANAKILGMIFTSVHNDKQKSYKGKYGYGYGYGSKKRKEKAAEADTGQQQTETEKE
ncbi:MAG: CpsD/CapB family tyrosine-protein kinase [Oscillospiraceae bacterium]|nr:CpsD/CapB family tyrosine-protein kinase [Oscillospiraceae bacterium]